MSKNTVWLENGVDRVLVDVSSAAEGYWRERGYGEQGASMPDESDLTEKPMKRVRARKTAEPSEA